MLFRSQHDVGAVHRHVGTRADGKADIGLGERGRIVDAITHPARPAVFFVARTRNEPAFDAEAFGAGNTQTRMELRDTIWITRGTPDLPEAIAHELFHVLANSGGHSEDRSNLMHQATAPGRRQLTAAQCALMVDTARKNKLLATD